MSVPNYKKKYLDEVRPHLMKKFEFTSIMQVPKIEKITLNIGIGNAKDNKKALQSALEELMLITGQKPVVTTAKKDISNFKVRKGFPVGCKVTLRKDFMYEFLERLCAVALPRTEILKVCLLSPSMVWVIIVLVLKSKLFLQKLIMIKLIQLEVWMLLLLLHPLTIMFVMNC